MIQAVIFDMDGVLVDSEPLHQIQIASFHKQYGKETPQDYLDSTVGKSEHDTWEETKAVWNEEITYEDYYRLYKEFNEKTPMQYNKVIFDGVRDVLTWLKGQGYKLAIASSSSMENIQMVMEQCNFDEFFEIKLSGEMFTHSKPDPEIYNTTVKQLGLTKEECIIVEDSIYGMEAAKRAGIRVIAKVDTRYGADASIADFKFKGYEEFIDLMKMIEKR